MKNKLLILGGNGFLGKHFQDFLLKYHPLDFEVVILDNKKIVESSFKQMQLDLLSGDELENIILSERPDYILNLAGVLHSNYPLIFLEINALLPLKILSIFARHEELKIKKILLIGSAAEYGLSNGSPLVETDTLSPINDYGFSKLVQANLVRYYSTIKKVPVCLARTFNIIGSDMPLSMSIGSFVNQIKNCQQGETIKTGYLEAERDYLDVEDVCSAYLKILFAGLTGEIYNVCSGHCIKTKEILEEMIEISGKQLLIQDQSDAEISDVMASCGNNKKLLNLGWSIENNISQSLKKLLL